MTIISTHRFVPVINGKFIAAMVGMQQDFTQEELDQPLGDGRRGFHIVNPDSNRVVEYVRTDGIFGQNTQPECMVFRSSDVVFRDCDALAPSIHIYA